MPDALLAAHDVSRRYGYRRVFDQVNLSLHSGDVLALMGPNGVGKTTLLRVLAGLLRPSSGTVARNGTVGLLKRFKRVGEGARPPGESGG